MSHEPSAYADGLRMLARRELSTAQIKARLLERDHAVEDVDLAIARLYARFSRPRNRSLNWFIPAFVKSSVGSSPGTSEELGTIACPFFSKYLRKLLRISRESIRLF